jgi:hypothetical protein
MKDEFKIIKAGDNNGTTKRERIRKKVKKK